MIARLALALTCATCLTAFAACDSANGTDEPATTCSYNYKVSNAALKDFGQSCTVNTECEFGVCVLPGAAGNIINTDFGYCTRGCNCDNDEDSFLSTDEKDTYTCLDPSGFKGSKRQVVPTCETLADCTAIDPAWTSCALPATGSARKVCQAQ